MRSVRNEKGLYFQVQLCESLNDFKICNIFVHFDLPQLLKCCSHFVLCTFRFVDFLLCFGASLLQFCSEFV